MTWIVFMTFVSVRSQQQPHTTHLAGVSTVDDLNPFLSGQTVHINLVWVPAAVPLLLGPPVLEVELHLHLIYTLDTNAGNVKLSNHIYSMKFN